MENSRHLAWCADFVLLYILGSQDAVTEKVDSFEQDVTGCVSLNTRRGNQQRTTRPCVDTLILVFGRCCTLVLRIREFSWGPSDSHVLFIGSCRLPEGATQAEFVTRTELH